MMSFLEQAGTVLDPTQTVLSCVMTWALLCDYERLPPRRLPRIPAWVGMVGLN